MGVVNLESICARYGMMLTDSGQDKMTDKENIVTKALGVLVQNGIYAMTVFLMTCNKPKYGENVLRTLAALLADKGVGLLPDRQWQEPSVSMMPFAGSRTRFPLVPAHSQTKPSTRTGCPLPRRRASRTSVSKSLFSSAEREPASRATP